jgi:hypothetical protein
MSYSIKIENVDGSSNHYFVNSNDVSFTIDIQAVEEKPGLRISILYLDMDLEKPTRAALNAFWNNVVPGGIVVFDEYAYHSWSESNAVDEFIADNDLYLHKTDVKAPTAYVIK